MPNRSHDSSRTRDEVREHLTFKSGQECSAATKGEGRWGNAGVQGNRIDGSEWRKGRQC